MRDPSDPKMQAGGRGRVGGVGVRGAPRAAPSTPRGASACRHRRALRPTADGLAAACLERAGPASGRPPLSPPPPPPPCSWTRPSSPTWRPSAPPCCPHATTTRWRASWPTCTRVRARAREAAQRGAAGGAWPPPCSPRAAAPPPPRRRRVLTARPLAFPVWDADFGTHVVTQIYAGGFQKLQLQMSAASYSALKQNSIQLAANVDGAYEGASAGVRRRPGGLAPGTLGWELWLGSGWPALSVALRCHDPTRRAATPLRAPRCNPSPPPPSPAPSGAAARQLAMLRALQPAPGQGCGWVWVGVGGWRARPLLGTWPLAHVAPPARRADGPAPPQRPAGPRGRDDGEVEQQHAGGQCPAAARRAAQRPQNQPAPADEAVAAAQRRRAPHPP